MDAGGAPRSAVDGTSTRSALLHVAVVLNGDPIRRGVSDPVGDEGNVDRVAGVRYEDCIIAEAGGEG